MVKCHQIPSQYLINTTGYLKHPCQHSEEGSVEYIDKYYSVCRLLQSLLTKIYFEGIKIIGYLYMYLM